MDIPFIPETGPSRKMFSALSISYATIIPLGEESFASLASVLLRRVGSGWIGSMGVFLESA